MTHGHHRTHQRQAPARRADHQGPRRGLPHRPIPARVSPRGVRRDTSQRVAGVPDGSGEDARLGAVRHRAPAEAAGPDARDTAQERAVRVPLTNISLFFGTKPKTHMVLSTYDHDGQKVADDLVLTRIVGIARKNTIIGVVKFREEVKP